MQFRLFESLKQKKDLAVFFAVDAVILLSVTAFLFMGLMNDSNLAVSPLFWGMLGLGCAMKKRIFPGNKNRLSTYINCKEVRTIDRESIQNLFAGNIRKLLIEAGPDYEKLYEIRLRVGRPCFLYMQGVNAFCR